VGGGKAAAGRGMIAAAVGGRRRVAGRRDASEPLQLALRRGGLWEAAAARARTF